MIGTLTPDFHHDTYRKGDLQLEVIDYPDADLIIFQLSIVGETETLHLDYMPSYYYPELLALYDFTAKQWVESELSCFWYGLQICLA